MKLFQRLFRREKVLCQDELVKPYCVKAKQAIILDDLPKAIAHLSCGIQIAPGHLNLYLQRAQILQYGLQNYARALVDYRFILQELAAQPDHALVGKCKDAMRDMMEEGSVHAVS